MPVSSWRFLPTGYQAGAINMAVDEVLLLGVAAGGCPVLRVYGWEPPAVSIGYAQRADSEVDMARCQNAGIDVVRRFTGGRAVLHWNELTYSVICNDGQVELSGSIEETHRRIGECLAEGMRLLGIDVELERGRPAGGRRDGGDPNAGAVHQPCFSSTARWEVKCGGRKLIGSAQRRIRGAMLQHGSVLLGPEHCRLPGLVPGSESCRASCLLAANSTDLQECAGHPIGFEEVASCLAVGFARSLGVVLDPSELTAEETVQARELAERKYGDPAFSAALSQGASLPDRLSPVP